MKRFIIGLLTSVFVVTGAGVATATEYGDNDTGGGTTYAYKAAVCLKVSGGGSVSVEDFALANYSGFVAPPGRTLRYYVTLQDDTNGFVYTRWPASGTYSIGPFSVDTRPDVVGSFADNYIPASGNPIVVFHVTNTSNQFVGETQLSWQTGFVKVNCNARDIS